MSPNLEARLSTLESGIPGGYKTFNERGEVMIDSRLPPLDWFRSTIDLFNSAGQETEKAALRAKLNASVGRDSGGGFLYQVAWAAACGPVEANR